MPSGSLKAQSTAVTVCDGIRFTTSSCRDLKKCDDIKVVFCNKDKYNMFITTAI